MAEHVSDPRVFFAAERTMLAWIRTGLTVIALGFVVARFGLFLSLLGAASPAMAATQHHHWLSNTVGIALVLLGTAVVIAATYNHRAFLRRLPVEDMPSLPLPWLTTFFSLAIAICGLVLAIYLAFP
jgi:putative membrane protein